jgi:hypothetical protein
MRLTLPSGRIVRFSKTTHESAEGKGLFAKAIGIVGSHLEDADVRDLELADFHALRAIAARLGWLSEEAIEITCVNCRKPMKVVPSSTFELGPFRDGELDDSELDRRGHDAPNMKLEPRTVKQAEPLHVALKHGALRITPKLVRALGVVEFDGSRDLGDITRRLRDCDDARFGEVQDAFLELAYPLRLGASHACPKCGARNEVDAPYERELFRSAAPITKEDFPSFDDFDIEVQRIAEKMLPDDVVLVVEGGVAHVDDGGVPLLGSYVPPFEGSDSAPSRPPEITVYFQTFRGMHEDDGPYDWRAELEETIEHELEHHGHHLTGHDPMDEEERAEIEREVVRTVGKREIVRRQTKGLVVDFADFIRRTWPLWIILLIVAIAWTVCGGSRD